MLGQGQLYPLAFLGSGSPVWAGDNDDDGDVDVGDDGP